MGSHKSKHMKSAKKHVKKSAKHVKKHSKKTSKKNKKHSSKKHHKSKHMKSAAKKVHAKLRHAKKLLKLQAKKVTAAKKVVVLKAKAKFLELKNIISVAHNLKFRVLKFRKLEASKANAVAASRKARKMLKKVIKGKNSTLIHAARLAVFAAKKTVSKLIKTSTILVKKNIKSLHKQGKRIGISVHIKMNCKCQPKVRSLNAKPMTPVKKTNKRILAPLKKMLDLN